MGITLLGVLFTVVLFACLAVMAQAVRKTAIDKPLQEGRARNSPVAEFVDDLLKYRWIVIIGLGVLVALDKSFDFSSGLLESEWVLIPLITAIFGVRLLLRRQSRDASQ